MVTLLARLDAAEHVSWVGTSMGGLDRPGPGSVCQRQPDPASLVLNDVGPKIEYASLQRIGQYLGQPAHWATLDEAADALWAISQGFGPHTRAQWLALTRATAQARWRRASSPTMTWPWRSLSAAVTPEMAAAGEAMTVGRLCCALRCPTLLLRGAESDLLSARDRAADDTARPEARRLHEPLPAWATRPCWCSRSRWRWCGTFLLGPAEEGPDEEV